MDKQEYLNQISATNRPEKSGGKMSKIFKSKYFLLGGGAVVAFILLAIIGGLIGGARGGAKAETCMLKVRIDNTMTIIGNYHKLVKSSILRSDSVALNGVLSNTNRDLENYLNEKYKLNGDDIIKSIGEDKLNELNADRDGSLAELFEAKINGNLDRIYAHKLTYETSVLLSEITRVYNGGSDDALKQILSTSYASLENLYNSISNFSEAK